MPRNLKIQMKWTNSYKKNLRVIQEELVNLNSSVNTNQIESVVYKIFL